MVVAEMLKRSLFAGREPQLYFWRDSNRNEVDLLVESDGQLRAIEIKSAATMRPDFFNNLNKFKEISGLAPENLSVIYGGDENYTTGTGTFVPWRNL